LIAQSYTDILRVLQAESGAGHGSLDLVELDFGMLAQASQTVASVDNLVTAEGRALFPKEAWRAATFDEKLRFVPHRLMWQAMIYNRVEVPDPPRTWDELLTFSRQHPGKVALKAARYEGATCDVMQFVWSAGGDETAPEAPGSLRAFDFLALLAPSLNPESAVFREMSVVQAQARGSVWIHFNWPLAIRYLASKGYSPAVDLSAPVPAGPDGTATPLGGGYVGIPTSAPHPELARDFIRYLLDAAVQKKLGREMGWFGTISPDPESADAKLYAGFDAMRPYVRARPPVDCYANLSNGWQRAARAVLFDNESPKGALATIGSGISSISTNSHDCECGR